MDIVFCELLKKIQYILHFIYKKMTLTLLQTDTRPETKWKTILHILNVRGTSRFKGDGEPPEKEIIIHKQFMSKNGPRPI